jgi:hypothetical protein
VEFSLGGGPCKSLKLERENGGFFLGGDPLGHPF